MRRQLAQALRLTRTVELRLDWLCSRREIEKFLAFFGRLRRTAPRVARATIIATCRRLLAGGRYSGSPSTQIALLGRAAEAGCAWIDLEIETAAGLGPARVKKALSPARCMISYHNFRCTPAGLAGRLRRLEHLHCDAEKIAAKANSLRDAWRLVKLAEARRRLVVIPMGEEAMPARLLALRAGSALAYAPVEKPTAPGQVSLKETKNLYRIDRLNRGTRIYGVIGNPVGHSLSPQMQNAGFQARRINAVYLPFPVRDLRDFLQAIERLEIAGFSVTLPHKEQILRHLDGCDALAEAIGAVNTVVVRGGGKLFGYNTDYVGVLRALERRMSLRGGRVLLLGAGGAARAVAFALAQGGAMVCVCARRVARAESLARAVGGEVVSRLHLRREFFDAIINATPVGMYPHAENSPLRLRELNCRLVFDLIYRPRETRLLRLAARRGIETVPGLDMFVAQGTAQWEIWTGERAPVAAMRRAVETVLEREERAQAPR